MQIPPPNNNNHNNGQRFHRGNPVITPNPNSPRNPIGQRVPRVPLNENAVITPHFPRIRLRLRVADQVVPQATAQAPERPIRIALLRATPRAIGQPPAPRRMIAIRANPQAIARNARAEAAPVQHANIPQNILLPPPNELDNRQQARASLRPRNLPREHQQ